MKKLFIFILAIFSVLWLVNSSYAMTVYTDKASFLSALSDYIIIDFEDYPPGAKLIPFNGDEYSSLGVVFRHPADPSIPPEWQQLFIHSGGYWGGGNFLSPGQPPDQPPYNHDDLIIDITINAYAFGVDLVDNAGGSGESVTIFGSSGVIYTHNSIPINFFGVIADEFITSVFFDENPGDVDDIGYDNIVIGEAMLVSIDIQPASCPSPLCLKRKGVLPVAVLGAEEFDVTTIDPATIKLSREGIEEGVSPLRWSYKDVATPFEGEPCDCHELGPDGYMDLTLKFKIQEVIETLNLHEDVEETIPLILTGNLKEEFGGTPIEGQDCVWVLERR